MEKAMRNRKQMMGALALASLLLSGCAAAAGAPATETQSPSPDPTAASAAPVSPGGTASASAAAAGGPSEASKMVCNDETKGDLSMILALKAAPRTDSSWAHSTYTCTYHLAEGPLVISVKESADPSSARKYFDTLQAKLPGAEPIRGLANLGFPAYQTTDGSVVFLKDNSILYVNAANLAAAVGPERVAPTDFAYQISTTILACWTEHH